MERAKFLLYLYLSVLQFTSVVIHCKHVQMSLSYNLISHMQNKENL